MHPEKEGKKKPATVKQPKPKPAKEKLSKPTPALKPKVTKEKPSKPSPTKHLKRGKVQKLRKGKPSLQLIDEDEPTQPEPEPEPKHQGEGDEYDVERAIQMSLESFQVQSQAHVGGVAIRELVLEATRPVLIVEGKGKVIATEEQAAQSLLALHTPKRRSTTNQFIFQRRTLATEEASTGPFAHPRDDTSVNIVRESPYPADAKTGVDTNKTNSRGNTEILQIGEEQGDDVANLVNLEEKTIEIDEGQAGSDPADEHVILEDPLSSTRTLSSMKNLDDAFTIGDQFINDKSTKNEPEKLNMEAEVVSMVTVPIYQASSSVPPLSTLIIDLLSPSKPKSKNLDNTTQNLRSMVFTLELQDLPHKINQTVNEVVKEAVNVAL
ncbi:hypothetical protein Tco_1496792 [Tanacetum coccineum]